jgi:hypothetical protein
MLFWNMCSHPDGADDADDYLPIAAAANAERGITLDVAMKKVARRYPCRAEGCRRDGAGGASG